MTDAERIADLQMQIEELRTALKPFVEVGRSYVSGGRMDRGCVWRSTLSYRPMCEVTVADFERAEALLEPPKVAA